MIKKIGYQEPERFEQRTNIPEWYTKIRGFMEAVIEKEFNNIHNKLKTKKGPTIIDIEMTKR